MKLSLPKKEDVVEDPLPKTTLPRQNSEYTSLIRAGGALTERSTAGAAGLVRNMSKMLPIQNSLFSLSREQSSKRMKSVGSDS
jgi:hypothetical protein